MKRIVRFDKKSFFLYFYGIIGISLFLRLLAIGFNDLLVEEAYYWNYAQHLDFGYLDHPPMVAVLIRFFTFILGNNEFGVRIGSIFCWLVATFYSFKLTNLIHRGSGIYSVVLLSILPFFFLQSLVITPDQPLTACWAASIYFLYRALVLNEDKYWYFAGIALGLGMLSKYTIVLLGLATLVYVLIVPKSRFWFTRKAPYGCLLITFLLFIPVIYWNATHDWVSFVFQGSRRFKTDFAFTLHEFLGFLMLFLMPPGILGLYQLYKKNSSIAVKISNDSKRFLQIFTLVPLLFFGFYSINHSIKFNWIGPSLLAIIPWLSILMKNSVDGVKEPTAYIKKYSLAAWFPTIFILLLIYTGMLFTITYGIPEALSKTIFKKYISWNDLTKQLNTIAKEVETSTGNTPVFVPLDSYNINSELGYYQAKLLTKGEISKSYSLQARHVFGGESLMYHYWLPVRDIASKTLILVSKEPYNFNNPAILQKTIKQSPVLKIYAHNQGEHASIKPYYYQVVLMKS